VGDSVPGMINDAVYAGMFFFLLAWSRDGSCTAQLFLKPEEQPAGFPYG
jgi:hypothetical protein